MSENLNCSPNIYCNDLVNDNVLSLSSKFLKEIPALNNKYLTVIYLENNKIESLPEDFFPSLPNLTWLDLRDNLLTGIPKTIQDHQNLSHLLLKNNKITKLPNVIGTVASLKVLQLGGNPIEYPPIDIIKAGTGRVTSFLLEQFLNECPESPSISSDIIYDQEKSVCDKARSYNSVLDDVGSKPRNMSIQFTEKENDSHDDYCSKGGKCPRLPKSRSKPVPFFQRKYLKPFRLPNNYVQKELLKENFLKELTLKKQKEIAEAREAILQGRRNIELLRNWRNDYRNRQLHQPHQKNEVTAEDFPYDTNAEYMTILTRADIEKDLPDKFKRRITRKCKPSVPRKNNQDLHLAMKIKQLFENLEAMDLNRQTMTPRSEQKALLGEIHKITEIKQKLNELSTSNFVSIPKD